jgi:hypothetical protein
MVIHRLPKNRTDSGQALLFVVVAMTIALAVSISVSLRTLSSISRVSTTDTAARALAAAEGGLERFLTKPTSDLNALASTCSNYEVASGEEACRVTFEPLLGGLIESQAVVSVETYGNDSEYSFVINDNATREINLEGYSSNTITVCWPGNGALYYMVYGMDDTGNVVYVSDLVCPSDGCNFSFDVGGALIAPGVGVCDPDDGFNITGLNGDIANPFGLRILLIGEGGTVRVIAGGSESFPVQGYRVTSTGELVESGNIQASRTMSVTKSLPYLPTLFDFGVYTSGSLP